VIVLIAWIAAVVMAALILGIVGFGLSGQRSRLQKSIAALQDEVTPQVAALQGAAQQHQSGGRHSAERWMK
jgi:uncharacterized protein HemX